MQGPGGLSLRRLRLRQRPQYRAQQPPSPRPLRSQQPARRAPEVERAPPRHSQARGPAHAVGCRGGGLPRPLLTGVRPRGCWGPWPASQVGGSRRWPSSDPSMVWHSSDLFAGGSGGCSQLLLGFLFLFFVFGKRRLLKARVRENLMDGNSAHAENPYLFVCLRSTLPRVSAKPGGSGGWTRYLDPPPRAQGRLCSPLCRRLRLHRPSALRSPQGPSLVMRNTVNGEAPLNKGYSPGHSLSDASEEVWGEVSIYGTLVKGKQAHSLAEGCC